MINIRLRLFALAALLSLICADAVLAQGTSYSDRCTVGASDITSVTAADSRNLSSRDPGMKELGTFDTVIREEELTTRTFRLPKTKLYIVAGVWYTDESMAGENSQDSISLQLTISKIPKRDVLSGLQFAEAQVLSANFDVARVSTIYRTANRRFFIVMECRKHSRP